jgi:hypothetical protein
MVAMNSPYVQIVVCLFVCLFVCLLVCGLFNKAVSSPDCIALTDGLSNEY